MALSVGAVEVGVEVGRVKVVVVSAVSVSCTGVDAPPFTSSDSSLVTEVPTFDTSGVKIAASFNTVGADMLTCLCGGLYARMYV